MLRSLLEKFKTKFENLADDDVDLVRYFFYFLDFCTLRDKPLEFAR